MSGCWAPGGFPRRCWVSRPAEPGPSLAGQFHELCAKLIQGKVSIITGSGTSRSINRSQPATASPRD